MQGLITLLSLSVVMAISSFLAGILPLSISLSRYQLRLISTIGMGVLVGTSMIVIIPEGVETLYKSTEVTHGHAKRMLGQHTATVQWAHHPVVMRSSLATKEDGLSLAELEAFNMPGPVIMDTVEDPPPATPTDSGRVGILGTANGDTGGTTHRAEREAEAHHAWIGVALILGFILMFLIDKLPQLKSTPQPKAKTHNIALNIIGRRFNLSNSPSQDDDEEHDSFIDPSHTLSHSTSPSQRGFSTTIGLVIHAAADGIALGASSTTSHTSLSLVIFFAIMIHKAPAAFGLTSILLQQGLSKRLVRAHLLLFSLAAPTGAILTYTLARILSAGPQQDPMATQWWTGVLLLFSAGTFLYVAMHSMQEILDGPRRDSREMNGHVSGMMDRRDSNAEPVVVDEKLSVTDVAAAVFGMVLPLFLQVRHAH